MSVIFRMAFRNVWRNKRRSLATLASVSLGMAAMLFLWSYNDSSVLDMKKNTTDFITGHLQIGAKESEKRRSFSPSRGLADSGSLMRELAKDSEVEAVSARLKTQALVGIEDRSQGVYVAGIDPAAESRVTRIREAVKEGGYLSGGKKEIILGQYLARKLRVKAGDRVVLMARDAYGMSMGYTFHVAGIFKLGHRFHDERCAYVDLASLQELLDNNAEVSEIAIRLKDINSLERYAAKLTARLGAEAGLGAETIAVRRWYDIAPEVNQWANWGNAVFFIVMIVVIIIIAMSIMNSMLMSVFERTREFGVMLALGTRPTQLMSLVLLETILLEFFGIVSGAILGFGLIEFYGKFGISLEKVAAALEQNFMSSVIYTSFSIDRVLQSSLVLVAVTLFTVMYPMARVGRLQPVRAIYRS